MDLVHRDRVALDLIQIILPRHGGKLPLPDPTRQEAEVSTKQGSGLFLPFPFSGLPALALSSTLCFADADNPLRNKRPRKRNPERTCASNEPDAESYHERNLQHREDKLGRV